MSELAICSDCDCELGMEGVRSDDDGRLLCPECKALEDRDAVVARGLVRGAP